MLEDEQIRILTKKEYLVVKGNELIQKSRFELSLQEQKTIAYICSMIKPIDTLDRINRVPFQLEYEFSIRDYCKVCGIDYNNGKNYTDIKNTLKQLRDRSMWISLENGDETVVGWLDRVTTNKRSGIAKVRIDDRLAPYLFELQEKFTKYELYNILAMKSAFSIRIYELMKSYAFQGTKIFYIDELKHLLMVNKIKSYERFPDFRRYVLEKAQEEINRLTDLTISYETITKGRKVVKIKFLIKQKGVAERMKVVWREN